MHFGSLVLAASALLAPARSVRFAMYYDQWHKDRPSSAADRAGIDHVILAFAQANNTAAFQPVIPISTVREEYPNAKVIIAIGGWGDTIGFSQAVVSDATMAAFAQNVAGLLQSTGADGVDIDWEYPGGNGADYKQTPNSAKTGEITAYPRFLAAIRTAIGPDMLLSIAVPGLERDMLAFTPETGPQIWPSVDFVNVMSYDLMNRRDNATRHHTSVKGAGQVIDKYLALGASPSKLNLGFAYYAKYFTTPTDCGAQALECPVSILEDPLTGEDTGLSGAWTFERAHMAPIVSSSISISPDGTCGPEVGFKCSSGCCGQYGYCGTSAQHCGGGCQHAFGSGCTGADVAGSWQRAAAGGLTDEVDGAQYFYDAAEKLFWSWDTPALVSRKFDEIVKAKGLGGVMAWSLGEDSYDWSHIKAMAEGVSRLGSATYASPVEYPVVSSSSPSPSPSLSEVPYTQVLNGPTDPDPNAPVVELPLSTPPETTSNSDSASESLPLAAPEDAYTDYAPFSEPPNDVDTPAYTPVPMPSAPEPQLATETRFDVPPSAWTPPPRDGPEENYPLVFADQPTDQQTETSATENAPAEGLDSSPDAVAVWEEEETATPSGAPESSLVSGGAGAGAGVDAEPEPEPEVTAWSSPSLLPLALDDLLVSIPIPTETGAEAEAAPEPDYEDPVQGGAGGDAGVDPDPAAAAAAEYEYGDGEEEEQTDISPYAAAVMPGDDIEEQDLVVEEYDPVEDVEFEDEDGDQPVRAGPGTQVGKNVVEPERKVVGSVGKDTAADEEYRVLAGKVRNTLPESVRGDEGVVERIMAVWEEGRGQRRVCKAWRA